MKQYRKKAAAAFLSAAMLFALPLPAVTVSADDAPLRYDPDSRTLTITGAFTAEDLAPYIAHYINNEDHTEEDEPGYYEYAEYPVSQILTVPGAVMPEDCSGLFAELGQTNLENPDPVILTKLDLSNADFSNVKNMSFMFGDTVIESVDLGEIVAENITNLGNMFMYSTVKSVDLCGLNTRHVFDMAYMFYGCQSLTTVYVDDSWSTVNVTDGDHMFGLCGSLVGGNGTAHDYHYNSSTYARIDQDGLPGYFTEKVTVGYDLSVAGKQVTSRNSDDILHDGVFSFDAAHNILSVKGDLRCRGDMIKSRIPGLTVSIDQDSSLTAAGCVFYFVDGATLTGEGRLTVSAGDTGIYFAGGDLRIQNITADISGEYGISDNSACTLIAENAALHVTGTKQAIAFIKNYSFYGVEVTAPENWWFRYYGFYDDAADTFAKEVTLTPYSPKIQTQPHSVTAPIGNTAEFFVGASGGDLSYEWQYNAGDGWKKSNGTGAATERLSIPITAGRNGYKYRCIVSNEYGRTATTVACTLKVKTKITAQPASLTKPVGEAAKFTVKATGAGLTYQWQYNKGDGWKNSNGTGAKTATLTISTAAGYHGYKYRCVIGNANNQPVTSSAATLTVRTAITAQPASLTKPVGEAAKFTVTATGAGLSYQWQYNKGDGWKTSNGTGAKTNTLTINTAAGYNNYQYRCVITDANGTKTNSSAATLTIKTAITAQPANASAAINEPAKFTVKATGAGLSYQWQYNSGSGWKNSGASGNKTAALTLYGKTTYNGWQFRCVITDANGKTTTSGTAVFKVRTAITAQPASVEATPGTAAKFTVKATGIGLSYQWQYNSGSGWKNSNAAGATTGTLTVSAKTSYNGWQYRCIITDANGAKTNSDAAALTVK